MALCVSRRARPLRSASAASRLREAQHELACSRLARGACGGCPRRSRHPARRQRDHAPARIGERPQRGSVGTAASCTGSACDDSVDLCDERFVKAVVGHDDQASVQRRQAVDYSSPPAVPLMAIDPAGEAREIELGSHAIGSAQTKVVVCRRRGRHGSDLVLCVGAFSHRACVLRRCSEHRDHRSENVLGRHRLRKRQRFRIGGSKHGLASTVEADPSEARSAVVSYDHEPVDTRVAAGLDDQAVATADRRARYSLGVDDDDE